MDPMPPEAHAARNDPHAYWTIDGVRGPGAPCEFGDDGGPDEGCHRIETDPLHLPGPTVTQGNPAPGPAVSPAALPTALPAALQPSVDPHEVALPLRGGWSLRSGVYNPGDPQALTSGDYVRLIDPTGDEVAYWDQTEWQEDPALVMGAILNAAIEHTAQA